ncbi:unnamed protein product [Closterium sp. Naga37s-1]|nr:unnamed protein product [Closterium sp. Naga37s-1]
MVTEGGDIVWQPGPNKTAVVSNAKGKQLLHLPWDNEELPPLPRTAEAGAVKAAAIALAPEFQEAELASGNTSAKGADGEKAEADAGNEPAGKAVVAPVAQAKMGSGEQAEEKAAKEAREEAVFSEETSAKASPPEPDAKEGTKQAGQASKTGQPSKKKPASPTARVLQADAAWGQRVWGSLISSWGRQSLMDEETDRN